MSGESCAHEAVIVAMTAEMVRKAAEIHRNALADSRTAIMGDAYVRAFIDWFRRPEHGGIALVAIDAQMCVLGYAIGAPLGYAKALGRDMSWIGAGAVIARPWLLFRGQFRHGLLDRVRLLLGRSQPRRSDPELPAPTMSLVAIGVAPAARRQKIGLRLVQAFETKAEELRMRSLRLSMRSDNFAARRLYERCGWRPFSDSEELTYYFRILDQHSEQNDPV